MTLGFAAIAAGGIDRAATTAKGSPSASRRAGHGFDVEPVTPARPAA